jgi:hypothetical protein
MTTPTYYQPANAVASSSTGYIPPKLRSFQERKREKEQSVRLAHQQLEQGEVVLAKRYLRGRGLTAIQRVDIGTTSSSTSTCLSATYVYHHTTTSQSPASYHPSSSPRSTTSKRLTTAVCTPDSSTTTQRCRWRCGNGCVQQRSCPPASIVNVSRRVPNSINTTKKLIHLIRFHTLFKPTTSSTSFDVHRLYTLTPA